MRKSIQAITNILVILAAIAVMVAALTKSACAANDTDPSRSDFYLEVCTDDKPECGTFISGFVSGTRGAVKWATAYEELLRKEQLFDGRLPQDAIATLIINMSMGCPSKGITVGQHRKVWAKYLNAHPETHHQRPYVTFTQAMRNAFPCNKKSAPMGEIRKITF